MRTSYSSLAMVAVGDLGCWWWSGRGVRRNGGLDGLLYARRGLVCARNEVIEGGGGGAGLGWWWWSYAPRGLFTVCLVRR